MENEKRIAELKQRIGKLQLQIAEVEGWKNKIRPLNDFAVEEKVAIFDKLYQQAENYLEETAKTGWSPKDGEEYLFEAVMTAMFGQEVWNLLSSLRHP